MTGSLQEIGSSYLVVRFVGYDSDDPTSTKIRALFSEPVARDEISLPDLGLYVPVVGWEGKELVIEAGKLCERVRAADVAGYYLARALDQPVCVDTTALGGGCDESRLERYRKRSK